jgi:hypothetical protein
MSRTIKNSSRSRSKKRSLTPRGSRKTTKEKHSPSTFLHYWGFSYYQTQEKPLVNYIEIPDDEVSKIFLGENHLLVKSKKKSLYGFGDNSVGQFGIAEKVKQLRPTLINFYPKISISKMTCGCDFTFIITKNHKQVFSWGFNCKGQLGQGHYEDVKSPFEVPFVRMEGAGKTATWNTIGLNEKFTGSAWIYEFCL